MSEEFRFAVVQSQDDTGVVVQFEGETEASSKKFVRLQSCNCIPGERVLMAPASGSYVVVGVVDRKKIINAETAETASTATSANSATSADTATVADKADRLSNSRTISLTGDVTASGSFNGSANLSMSATGVKSDAVKDQLSPSARNIQFRVTTYGKLQFKSSYYGNTWYNMDGTQG